MDEFYRIQNDNGYHKSMDRMGERNRSSQNQGSQSMKWIYYIDEYGDRWVDENKRYSIRVNGIGRFYIEDYDDLVDDGFDTITEAKLYCEQHEQRPAPKENEVWGDPDDPTTWRKIINKGTSGAVSWEEFGKGGYAVTTIAVWNEWVNKTKALIYRKEEE